MEADYVYIVEDDSIASYVIKLAIDDHSSFKKCSEFKNGKLAFDQLVQKSQKPDELPDIILLDINMPVMDGWEFLEEFSKLEYNKQISVIILTSSINPEDEERARSFKVVKGFLSKPLTSEKLDQVEDLI